MDTLEKQDTITGRLEGPIPTPASAEESTADRSKPVQTNKESSSIETALVLALLQTDLSDLQSKGLKVVILAKDDKLYASIEWAGHVLAISDTGKKNILLDGKPVTEYE